MIFEERYAIFSEDFPPSITEAVEKGIFYSINTAIASAYAKADKTQRDVCIFQEVCDFNINYETELKLKNKGLLVIISGKPFLRTNFKIQPIKIRKVK